MSMSLEAAICDLFVAEIGLPNVPANAEINPSGGQDSPVRGRLTTCRIMHGCVARRSMRGNNTSTRYNEVWHSSETPTTLAPELRIRVHWRIFGGRRKSVQKTYFCAKDARRKMDEKWTNKWMKKCVVGDSFAFSHFFVGRKIDEQWTKNGRKMGGRKMSESAHDATQEINSHRLQSAPKHTPRPLLVGAAQSSNRPPQFC